LAKWVSVVLFREKSPSVELWLLPVMYSDHVTRVVLNGVQSRWFAVLNGANYRLGFSAEYYSVSMLTISWRQWVVLLKICLLEWRCACFCWRWCIIRADSICNVKNMHSVIWHLKQPSLSLLVCESRTTATALGFDRDV